MSDTARTTLGKYELIEKLGEGATAVVYRARDTQLGREVALKVLHPGLTVDRAALGRFLQEAQSAAGLFHPHIATVLDAGEQQGFYFIAVRFIPGQTLARLISERGPLPWKAALAVTAQVGQALHYAHQLGFVHRDVKPQNILIHPQEGAVLTDFGLARAVSQTDSSTRSGGLLGTPQYLPAEVWNGQTAGPAADQFALACVLVEMLAGASPFAAPSPAAVMKRIFEPPRLPANFPPWLAGVLARALLPDPARRFAGMDEFLAALGASAPPAPAPPPAQASVKPPSPARAQRARSSAPLSPPPPAAAGERLRLELEPGVLMEFVHVPAGEFVMGSDPRRDPLAAMDELPPHAVGLDEYWIGRFPVTNRQYAAYVHAANRSAPEHWLKGEIPKGQEEHPVVYVSWPQAVAFCEWLAQVAGRGLVRLPSEAEWEKAARGTDGRVYPWGNQAAAHTLCNFEKKLGATSPVGKYSPRGDSPYGCADQAGNVWEWCADWYGEDDYRAARAFNPGGPPSGQHRAARGGSWLTSAVSVRAANREWYLPDMASGGIGFRCLWVAG